MTITPSDAHRALCAKYLMAFVQAAFKVLYPDATFHAALYVRALCHQLERVERGEIRRLLIILPPRHLKSFCASVVFPVWVHGRNPSLKMLTTSYGASLAEDFSWQSRRLSESDLVRSVFPALEIDKKKASVADLRTTKGGHPHCACSISSKVGHWSVRAGSQHSLQIHRIDVGPLKADTMMMAQILKPQQHKLAHGALLLCFKA